MKGPEWQNERLRELLPKGSFALNDVRSLETELARRGTLTTAALPSGLFPASTGDAPGSGYGNVWVRDNTYVAYAHLVRGQGDVAARAVLSLLHFWEAHRGRFDAVIAGGVAPSSVMERPHIRFDGVRLRELTEEQWPHAQNDALGYALWLSTRLIARGHLPLSRPVVVMLQLLPRYLHAIRYWQDQDSGHWEEAPKRSASSIGTALAGLEGLLALRLTHLAALRDAGFDERVLDLVGELSGEGRRALTAILPHESLDPPPLARRYDAALIFLVHPLGVVSGRAALDILTDVEQVLTGPFGIRRYPGDSYWAPDYDLRLGLEDRTRDYSSDVALRDALLERAGDEAQWCIFDPMLSAYYGRRYLETRSAADLELQRHHLERCLAQVTPDWRCPELYYKRHGAFAPGPHTPLLWTTANLGTALAALRASAAAT
jgi:GH15 family glucan-1,4-alpha-glucosidase